jgi:hypothetical protein
MTVLNRLIAATYLAVCCNPDEFWRVASDILSSGIDPAEFDISLLSASH